MVGKGRFEDYLGSLSFFRMESHLAPLVLKVTRTPASRAKVSVTLNEPRTFSQISQLF
jgi:hypothetical protein